MLLTLTSVKFSIYYTGRHPEDSWLTRRDTVSPVYGAGHTFT